jgi:hypothetical protein
VAGTKPGPPSRGHEEVEELVLQGQILNLRDRNYTHQEIADSLGLARSTVTRMLKRINERTLAEFDRQSIRALTLRKYLKIEAEILPFVMNVNGLPDFMPNDKMLDKWLKVQLSIRQLMGADAPTRVEISVPDPDATEDSVARKLAEDLGRFQDLADQMIRRQMGSGRVIDAEVVEEDADEVAAQEALNDPTKRVRGPGSDAPQYEITAAEVGQVAPDETTMAAYARIEDLDGPDMTDDGLDDDPIGVWKDGKFYATDNSSE